MSKDLQEEIRELRIQCKNAEHAKNMMQEALEKQKNKNKFYIHNMYRMINELLPEDAHTNSYIKQHLANVDSKF